NGVVPKVGERWVQRDLAKLFRRLGEEGPSAFYRGEIPRQITRQIHENGGILNEEDFSQYRPRSVEPLTISYRGHALFTPPPPSGGISTFQILKVLEQFDLAAMGRWSGEYFHTLVEATKLAWRDRNEFLGDPDTARIPIAKL